MAYQSLKRVLGETSLERKCRFFFGTCLLLLIAIAFIWVDQIGENLVYRTAEQDRLAIRHRGRACAHISLLKIHFQVWHVDDQDKALVQEITRGLEDQTYSSEILALTENKKLGIRKPREAEEDVLKQLQEQSRQQPTASNRPVQASATDASEADNVREPNGPNSDASLAVDDAHRVFQERFVPEKGEYQYYQMVYWKKGCANVCHPSLQSAGAVPAASYDQLFRNYEPLRVVKIVMPYRESTSSIHQIRAILSAIGIGTFFLAMVTLYVIVRNVIVTPLKHLRDVSDAISRGKTELRAEIHTNDEFEELAESFNRMLRHLTDTQLTVEQANRDLDAKVDELAQLNMRLYEMNRLKSDFLANISHELRTPLNSIIGFSEVLHGIDSLTDKQKRYAQNIQKSGRVLLEMINDVLDLAKIDAGKMEIRASEFRIEPIVQAQCDMVRALTEEKNIELACEIDAQLPPMFTDQFKVQQILTNLLSNAIKFTPEGGRITVQAKRNDEGRLVLTVADTGVGIAEEDREIVFEKFRQSRTVTGTDGLTREYSGTGLGLSIVKELCKLLRGEIDFESELGKGSTFRVVLPWTLDDLPAEPTTSADFRSRVEASRS